MTLSIGKVFQMQTPRCLTNLTFTGIDVRITRRKLYQHGTPSYSIAFVRSCLLEKQGFSALIGTEIGNICAVLVTGTVESV